MQMNLWPSHFTVTTRRRKIAELLLAEKSRKDIANTMEIKYNSVSQYIADLCRVLGVASKDELIAILRTKGLPNVSDKVSNKPKKVELVLTVTSVLRPGQNATDNPNQPQMLLFLLESKPGSYIPHRWWTVINRHLPNAKKVFDETRIEEGKVLIRDLQGFARLHGDDLQVEFFQIPWDTYEKMRKVF